MMLPDLPRSVTAFPDWLLVGVVHVTDSTSKLTSLANVESQVLATLAHPQSVSFGSFSDFLDLPDARSLIHVLR